MFVHISAVERAGLIGRGALMCAGDGRSWVAARSWVAGHLNAQEAGRTVVVSNFNQISRCQHPIDRRAANVQPLGCPRRAETLVF